MIEALAIDAASAIRLLESIEVLYPMLVLIHENKYSWNAYFRLT